MENLFSMNSIVFLQIVAMIPLIFQAQLFDVKDVAKYLTEKRRSVIRRIFFGLITLKALATFAGRSIEGDSWTMFVVSLALFMGWDKWIRTMLVLNRTQEELDKSHLASKERMEHDERIVELEEEIQDLMEEAKAQHLAAKEYEAQLKERQKQFFHKIKDHAKTLTDTLQETEEELKKLRLDGIAKDQYLKEKDDELERLKRIILDWQKKYHIGDEESRIATTIGDGPPPTPTKDNQQRAIQDAIEALRHFEEDDGSVASKKTFPEEDDRDKSPKEPNEPTSSGDMQFSGLQQRGKKTRTRDVFSLWRKN
eukprot:TRINITY_DN2418_c0_g1_i1.p1 TRINITY_DN2418_c0_g1~~TRINITY_DN2418_c0_g1_i1.p1  ORF type:complete len:310 (+),score=107.01 TRINITY_DN2418_c0_g1_i1:68-997(+)